MCGYKILYYESMRVRLLLTLALTCNQHVYDMIYESILRQALESKLTQKDMEYRNNAIETLKKLCNNQTFSLETGKRSIK